MTRKRKTRARLSRTKPKIPKGDEGVNLEKDIKMEKLKTLLADFDSEMSSFYSGMKESLRDYEKSIQCSYRMCISKIPKYVRDMDIEDYLKAGGQMTTEVCAEHFEMLLETDLPNSSLPKSKKKKKGKQSATQEESGTLQRPAPRRKKIALRSNALENMPPPSTMRTGRRTQQRGLYETPFQRGGPSTAGWETPLITPKFDPRLPVTPTMTRRRRTGEVLVSLAGSPVTDAGNRHTMVPKSRKPVLIVDNREFNLDDIEIPAFEQTTKDYLRLLKQKLNAIPLSPTPNT